MSFSGFSEDDIRKLTKNNDINKAHQKGPPHKNTKKVTIKHNSRSRAILNNNVASNNTPLQELPENAKLSVPNKSVNAANTVQKPQEQDSQEKVNEASSQPKTQEIEAVNGNKKFKNLEEFEAKQKLIEEQNRKRKELLVKALADRTKQTQEEAQRLSEIQEEFKKLDAILSDDVRILRKQIELASVEYMECQKRYNKIEKEFLDAKILLHQKQEKKEMLTEHLCAIIEKNEERKAEKLNELLEKLQSTAPINILSESGDTANEKSIEGTK